MAAQIRIAQEEDVQKMLAIYAPIVKETAISFELEPPTEREFRRRIGNTLDRTPWLVCDEGSDLLGYAYASPYRSRGAYQWSVEVSVYVDDRHRGRGVGRGLYTSLLACLRVQGYVNAYAVIALPNPASVIFHERLGFVPAGIHRSAGYKLGGWHDVGYWQLTLRELPSVPKRPRALAEVVDSPGWSRALRSGIEGLRL